MSEVINLFKKDGEGPAVEQRAKELTQEALVGILETQRLFSRDVSLGDVADINGVIILLSHTDGGSSRYIRKYGCSDIELVGLLEYCKTGVLSCLEQRTFSISDDPEPTTKPTELEEEKE